jgi:nitrogen-specific signal transduction histidine kinase
VHHRVFSFSSILASTIFLNAGIRRHEEREKAQDEEVKKNVMMLSLEIKNPLQW